DRAILHDSALNDLLEADQGGVQVSNETLGFLCRAEEFTRVTATATDGDDTASVGDLLPYELDLQGPWTA
ncbi:MAG: hypothetical protein GY798_30120, partial [Hyphomicrobiales bacterium]|nr:hypothetical protein [Hyphomicrobiales bacterium]